MEEKIFLLRFMSGDELKKYLKGEVLVNNKNHSRTNRSNSKGFCFVPIKKTDTYFKEDKIDVIFNAHDYLCGIVDDSYVVIMKTDKDNVTLSSGEYAGYDFYSREVKSEYCAKKYSLKTFRALDIFKKEGSMFKAIGRGTARKELGIE